MCIILTCLILRQVPNSMPILREKYGSFSIKRLRVSAGVRKDVSDETMRCLGVSYRVLHSIKKGLLKKNIS